MATPKTKKKAEIACVKSNLTVVAQGGDFKIWNYRHAEHGMGQITQAGYFDNVKDRLGHGDMLIINSSDIVGTQVFVHHDEAGNPRI